MSEKRLSSLADMEKRVFRVLISQNATMPDYLNEKDTAVLARYGDGPHRRFCRESMADPWMTVDFGFCERTKEPLSDFFWMSFAGFGFLEELAEFVEPSLSASGELLPITLEGNAAYAYNVTNVLDVIDYERSEFHYFRTGEIMTFKTSVISMESLCGSQLFKLPIDQTAIFAFEDPHDELSLRLICETHGYSGLEFAELETS
ncbi:MAG: hypothetical protein AAGF35_08310 [Pseudomonadota bacterium]